MQITSAQVQKILNGSYTFAMLGFSLMVTRLQAVYKKEPTQEKLHLCIAEIDAFLQKYSSIMPADLAVISKI